MNFKFMNKKITGILTVLPQNEIRFEDEVSNYNFPIQQSLRLKRIMGYDKHRIVDEKTCVSDLCLFGLNYLINEGFLKKDDIDALILLTQTPDYFIPPTSNLIQGQLKLKKDMICLDINQGCAGYLIGLIQAFMLLEQDEVSKVVLLNADILSRKTSKKDRNSYPLTGDAACITIIENSETECNIFANLKMHGGKAKTLMIPAGGLKMPSSVETSILEDDGDGNFRSKDNLTMDGTSVFNFVQTEVPLMINNLLRHSKISREEIDLFMFHQPNKFMLKKLADKMKIPYSKMPNNIVENFGNASGATIPTNITYNIGKDSTRNSYKLCLAGFGAGLVCSSMILDIGYLDFCSMIEYRKDNLK